MHGDSAMNRTITTYITIAVGLCFLFTASMFAQDVAAQNVRDSMTSGISTSDAGKLQCAGTLGGGAVSEDRLREGCLRYVERLENASEGRIIYGFDIVRDSIIVGVGILIGAAGSVFLRSRKRAKTREK